VSLQREGLVREAPLRDPGAEDAQAAQFALGVGGAQGGVSARCTNICMYRVELYRGFFGAAAAAVSS